MDIRAGLCGFLLVVCGGCTYGGLGESSGGATETLPAPTATLPAQQPVANCDRPAAKPARGEVLVYLAKTDFDQRLPADRRNFVAVARPLSDADALTPLNAALRELFEGTTPSERRLGCVSTFADQEHLLRRVELVDGAAVVDFHRRAFLDELGAVSTSHAGAVFSRQIELTAFQFPQVRSVRLELNGDCKAFGWFAQVGECVVFRRGR